MNRRCWRLGAPPYGGCAPMPADRDGLLLDEFGKAAWGSYETFQAVGSTSHGVRPRDFDGMADRLRLF